MDQKEQTKIANKILDNFQMLRHENLKLRLENEKLKKQLESFQKHINEQSNIFVEQNNATKKAKDDYKELKERYHELYDSLYECETMLREFGELCWHLEKMMPALKKFNKKIEKKYKFKVTFGETIVAGPPDSLGSFGRW